MGRLLVFALAVFGLIWLLKRALGGRADGGVGQARGERAAPGDLVRCAHCGLHSAARRSAAARAGAFTAARSTPGSVRRRD